MLIGFPNETQDTVQRTIDFGLSLPLSDFQITFLTPFQSEVYEIAKTTGEFDGDDWEHMNMWDIIFGSQYVDQKLSYKKKE